MAGHDAVIIHCATVIKDLWTGLLENPSEQLPWQAPLLDIARNFYGNGDITSGLGDLFYFQPQKHGYFARKIAIEAEKKEGKIVAKPRTFSQGSEVYSPSESILDQCWTLGHRLMTAITPLKCPKATFDLSIQRLKYQDTQRDFRLLGNLTKNSMGRWSRLGSSLDEKKWTAAGPLNRRGISDAYGLVGQIPWVKSLAQKINQYFLRKDPHLIIEPGQELIEGAHYDHRFFTALCGKRDRMITQLFVDGKWIDLPINLEVIIVFPGSLSTQAFNIKPTLHRVLHSNRQDLLDADVRTGNVTLLLGAS
jgi:hypothetical protein